MRLKFLSIIAVVALVSACETAPQESASAGGSGGVNATVQYPSGTAAKVVKNAAVAGIKLGTQEDLVVNVGDRVFFDFDKYNLSSNARRTLEKQAVWLKKYPALLIIVAGHTDERGTREYNLALGERRASSTKDYLVALGVAASRIKTISYGKERPVALGSNEAAWAQNRRSVTKVR